MLNTVEYCRILGIFKIIFFVNAILRHFLPLLNHFYMFLHYSTLTNKKTNNHSFWFGFSDLNQIIYSFWFVSIQHYLPFLGESCWMICFALFRFSSFYNLNHLFFDSFQFILGFRFNLATNQITKSTIRPSLVIWLKITFAKMSLIIVHQK